MHANTDTADHRHKALVWKPSLKPADPNTMPPQSPGECVFHCTRDHRSEAFRTMHQMRQHRELCDIRLRAGEITVDAHKVVLAATSPYFRAMFTNEMVEKNSSEIIIHEVDSHALQLLVDYAYSSEILVSENNVQVLLPAACLLQINSVRDACCKFLMKQLHPTNCLGIRRFADTHACDDLLKLSHQFTLHNFVDVCDTEEFLLLSPKDVKDLVSSEELNIVSEEEVFKSVVKWIKQDMENRQQYIYELLSSIRLPLLTRDFLMNAVENDQVVRSSPHCKDLLIEAMKYHLLPEQRSLIQSDRTRPRRSKGLRSLIFSVGGGSLFAIHTESECYDPSTDQWTMIAPMTTKRSRAGVTVALTNLYAIGGYDGASDLATAECYNPRVNKWNRIATMGTKRSCLGVCEWNGLIFAAGGYDGASCLNSVERYDSLTLTWTSVAAMNFRRRYLKLAVLDNYIYAVGGYDGSSHMASVEKLDPKSNKWVAAPNMISRRSNAGVAVLDGMIYVCGGNDGSTCLSSVERFNPRRNIWEAVASMHSRRSTHDVVVLDGILYAIGGNDGSTSLNSVERYNPKTNRWQLITPMNLRRSSVGAAILQVNKTRNTLTAPVSMCH